VIDSFDLTASKVSAETTDRVSVVSVQGEGVMLVKPDLAYINIGVETRDENASVAQAENKEKMLAVLDSLKMAGIKEVDMVTTNYNIYRSYDYNRAPLENGQQPSVYQVDNTVKVTIRDIDRVGDFIDAAFNAGANVVHNIQFDVEDRAAYYNEALVLAMANAKDKAAAIMSTFDEVADKPYKVYEASYSSAPYTNTYYEASDMKMASTPVQAGELAIKATLTVEYDY